MRRLAGSYAGFLVLPSFVAAIALAVGATGVHMSMYSCSLGELAGLQLAGMRHALAFMPSQDRYTLALDASFRQVVLQANGTDYLARDIRIHPGQERGSSCSASALVELHNMTIPRIAEVEGLRSSAKSAGHHLLSALRTETDVASEVADCRCTRFHTTLLCFQCTSREPAFHPDGC